MTTATKSNCIRWMLEIQEIIDSVQTLGDGYPYEYAHKQAIAKLNEALDEMNNYLKAVS